MLTPQRLLIAITSYKRGFIIGRVITVIRRTFLIFQCAYHLFYTRPQEDVVEDKPTPVVALPPDNTRLYSPGLTLVYDSDEPGLHEITRRGGRR